MAEKICVVCLSDVAGKPRLKDAQLRYYCQSCYDALLAQGYNRPPTDEELAAMRSGANAPGTTPTILPPLPLEPANDS